jgi:hypothetical protein
MSDSFRYFYSFTNLILFLKISLFFLGITFVIAYFLHRIIFILNSRSLAKHFPPAFKKSFECVTDFFELMLQSKDFESNRFLTQAMSRKDLHLPVKFLDLPSKIALSAYQKLRKQHEEYKKNPEKISDMIRENTFQEYYQAYRYQVLNESFNWLLISIPFACSTGILLPLVIYFYFPVILRQWPNSWTVAGILLAILTLLLTLRDYVLKR